jgi:hypothetical protein
MRDPKIVGSVGVWGWLFILAMAGGASLLVFLGLKFGAWLARVMGA